MDSGFSIAIRTSELNGDETAPAPTGDRITIREEFEYVKDKLRRLR